MFLLLQCLLKTSYNKQSTFVLCIERIFIFVISKQTSKCETHLNFLPLVSAKQKNEPRSLKNISMCDVLQTSFGMNIFHSMGNVLGQFAAGWIIFSIFHSTATWVVWKEENENLNAIFHPTTDERVHSSKDKNWHQALFVLWKYTLSLTKFPYNPTKIEPVYKLVSLLWNSQASPQAINSIPLLKVELYYIVLHKNETWEMREQRRKAKNLSLRIFVLFFWEFIITQIYALHLKLCLKWSSWKLFKC